MPDKYGQPIRLSERATQAALKRERRKPEPSDAPPPSTFPGPKVKPTPGQLDIDGKIA